MTHTFEPATTPRHSAPADPLTGGTAARRRATLALLLAAPLCFTLLFVVLPLLAMLLYSFWTVRGANIVPEWTLEHYRDVLTKALFYRQMFKSLQLALIVTGICLLLGYPAAYFLATLPPGTRNGWLLLLLVPMWSSYVVRVYAWRTILGLDGVLNSLLVGTGLLAQPSRAFSFNQIAVGITLTNYLLPFMILPLVATLERIPASQTEAARDLGSRPLDAFWRVLLPLSLPGAFVGALNVFIVALADYLTPGLVGGKEGLMIGNVIQSEFGAAFNWPLGAAATYVTAALALSLLVLARWLTHRRAAEVRF